MYRLVGDRSRFWQTLVSLVCIALMTYFAYHAINGRFGLEARSRLQSRIELLERQLARLEADRKRLGRNIALLDRDKLDPDMLDEQARRLLSFSYPDELILSEAIAWR